MSAHTSGKTRAVNVSLTNFSRTNFPLPGFFFLFYFSVPSGSDVCVNNLLSVLQGNKLLNITHNKVAGECKFLDGWKMNKRKYGKIDWIVKQIQLDRTDSFIKSLQYSFSFLNG